MRFVLTMCIVSSLAMCGAQAARFTDTFSTLPTEAGRQPFEWDGFVAGGDEAPWQVVDGALQYKVTDGTGAGATAYVSLATAGIKLTDTTDWSLETGFRHIAGTAPRPGFEALAYITWFSPDTGQMRVLAPLYDAANKRLLVLNGGQQEPPVAFDLSGEFHQVRITVKAREATVYVDGEAKVGPFALQSITYSQSEAIYLGPITGGDKHTLQYQFDYLAFTDEGAIPAGKDSPWQPALDKEPVAEGLVKVANPLSMPPYPNIHVLPLERGTASFDAAIPEHWRALRGLIKTEPAQIESPLYTYADAPGASKQNIYYNSQGLKCGNRVVAISHLTRGTDDTGPGFMDYKLWYRVSTDGGATYAPHHPMVEQGAEFTPMHPNRYVWIGKNSFCYGAIPPFIEMSNGQVLMPFYFAPLDENGNYYNPVGAYTFTYVAAMIGTWNADGTDLTWEASQDIRLTGDQSSRGSNECAVAELGTPGHILMFTRGSNAPNPKGVIPACKWKTLSTDFGKTWSEYTPLTFEDGEQFLSPSAMSCLVRSSRTGKLYWIGNISRVTPNGNWPRYPLVIAEVDEETLCLRKETVTVIDDRKPGDAQGMELSNLTPIEDPATGRILITLERTQAGGAAANAVSGYVTYTVEVK